ncbi:MAG: tyrosine-type recombinase/integrase [Ktedonobacteraceae bacterium]
MGKSYWFAPRPPEVSHQHPFLVFDCQDQLHFELTVFGKEAAARVEKKTVEGYLRAVLPFFTYLETDEWQVRAGQNWKRAPETIRRAVEDYLIHQLHCIARQHRQGFRLVLKTDQTHHTVKSFLSGLKFFYQMMCQQGYYGHPNPLVDSGSSMMQFLEAQDSEEAPPPRMPASSGVVAPPQKRKPRLTDSYFKLEDERWIPQVVNDPTLFARVLRGGRQLKHWGMREECVTRILFESGCRVSEAVGLTLCDWVARGITQEATAFSKGSHGRRVKFLRFSSETAKLLRRYFDGERRRLDPQGRTLEEYLREAKQGQGDLHTIPLFLSRQRTALSAKTYREHSWNPACQAAQIDADVHQARHWHVTQAVRYIYETSQAEGDVQRRLQELVEYMKWRSKETLEAYEHYFDAARHAETLDVLHARMYEELERFASQPQTQSAARPRKGQKISTELVEALSADEPDLDFLYQLGGSLS